MAGTIERVVDVAGDERLEPYRELTRRSLETRIPELFIVEGQIALERALEAGWRPRSIVATPTKVTVLGETVPDGVPVLELDAAALRELVGFDFHRGCLGAFERPPVDRHPDAALVQRLAARGRSTTVVAQGLADPANLGAVARTARALGADLLVADMQGADPYERRAIRASMGHVLALPLVCSPDLVETITSLRRASNARVVAATTSVTARPLHPGRPADHLVVLVGNEGVGLPDALVQCADEEVEIPMASGVDSLNVATALGIVLWAMR